MVTLVVALPSRSCRQVSLEILAGKLQRRGQKTSLHRIGRSPTGLRRSRSVRVLQQDGFELLMGWITSDGAADATARIAVIDQLCRHHAHASRRSCATPVRIISSPPQRSSKNTSALPGAAGAPRSVIAAQPGMKKKDLPSPVSMISRPTGVASSLSNGPLGLRGRGHLCRHANA